MDDFLEMRKRVYKDILKYGHYILGKRFYGFKRINYLAKSIQRQKELSEFLKDYGEFEEESRKVRLVARGLSGVVVGLDGVVVGV